MSVTTVTLVKEFNKFPEELEKKFRPFPEEGAVFKIEPQEYTQVYTSERTISTQNTNRQKVSPASYKSVVGTKSIPKRWTIIHENKPIECGFFTGYEGEVEKFETLFFREGELRLLPGEQYSEFFYKLLQIHPNNSDSKFKTNGIFREIFPEKEDKSQADNLVKRSMLVTEVSILSDIDKKYIVKLANVSNYSELIKNTMGSEAGYQNTSKAFANVFSARLKDALEFSLKDKFVDIDDTTGVVKIGKSPVGGLNLKDVASHVKIETLIEQLLDSKNKKASDSVIEHFDAVKADTLAQQKAKS